MGVFFTSNFYNVLENFNTDNLTSKYQPTLGHTNLTDVTAITEVVGTHNVMF